MRSTDSRVDARIETTPSGSTEKMKVLVLSRSYPNSILPLHGLWVQRLVRHLATHCEVKVVAPVQYCPPLPGLPEYYRRFRRIEEQSWSGSVEVLHPRYPVGPGTLLHGVEATGCYLGIRGSVARLRRDFPFDLIHAHHTYPDGVVAARLSRQFGVPFVVTEQSPWLPWMAERAYIRRQALWAANRSKYQVAISRLVRDEMVQLLGDSSRVRIIPDGVDGEAFTPGADSTNWNPNQIVFVGFINYIKGFDILLKALQQLGQRRPNTRLVVVGGSYFRGKKILEDRLRQMTVDLGLSNVVQFAGTKSLPDLVQTIRESALLVLPSRSESFGSVLVEALACGTPVVATKCGGPEDIVTDEVGRLVPREDPDALATALEDVLENRHRFDPASLRRYALANFDWARIAEKYIDLYREALDRSFIKQSEGV